MSSSEQLSVEEAMKRLKANGAGRGLFEGPPILSNDSLTAVMIEEASLRAVPAPAPRAAPPRWFLPVVGAVVPAMIAIAASTLYNPGGGAAAAGAPAAAPREHVASAHPLTRRGLYVDIDMDDLEFYEEAAPTARAGKTAAASPAPAAVRAKQKAGLALADLSGFGVGFAPQPIYTQAQTSAAKREAGFLELTRQVRRRCRGVADAAPTSVLLRAHVVIAKNGSASEVKLDGNSSAVAACVEQEIRSFKFPDEAALGTIDVPFSWRKQ